MSYLDPSGCMYARGCNPRYTLYMAKVETNPKDAIKFPSFITVFSRKRLNQRSSKLQPRDNQASAYFEEARNESEEKKT